jgi:hypothetical protein
MHKLPSEEMDPLGVDQSRSPPREVLLSHYEGSRWLVSCIWQPLEAVSPPERSVSFLGRRQVISTHASVLVDSVGPPSAEVCRAAASFP